MPNNNNYTSEQPDFSEASLLIEHIRYGPQYAHLVKLANQKVKQPEGIEKKKSTPFKWLRNLFFSNPEEYSGKAIVTRDLNEHSKITARTVTVANLINFTSTLPLLYYAFNFMQIPALALVTSFSIGMCLLLFGNLAAAAVASRKPMNFAWAAMALLGLVSINLIQTLVSGIGVELFNNKSELIEIKATELVGKLKRNIESEVEKKDNDQIAEREKIEAGCNALREKINIARRDGQEDLVHSLNREAFGLVNGKEADLSGSFDSYPTCEKFKHWKESKEYKAFKAEEENLKPLNNISMDYGSNLYLLKKEYTETYNTYFTDDDISNGVETVRLAIWNFLSKLESGRFSELGFSLFISSISVITSATACLMIVAHASRKDTKMSRSSVIEQTRNSWFEQQWRLLLRQQQTELESFHTNESTFEHLANSANNNSQEASSGYSPLIVSKTVTTFQGHLEPNPDEQLKYKRLSSLKNQQECNKYLFKLFEEEVKETGRYDYPKLIEVVEKAYIKGKNIYQEQQSETVENASSDESSKEEGHKVTYPAPKVPENYLNSTMRQLQPVLTKPENVSQHTNRLPLTTEIELQSAAIELENPAINHLKNNDLVEASLVADSEHDKSFETRTPYHLTSSSSKSNNQLTEKELIQLMGGVMPMIEEHVKKWNQKAIDIRFQQKQLSPSQKKFYNCFDMFRNYLNAIAEFTKQ
jgi:hypothetical protein